MVNLVIDNSYAEISSDYQQTGLLRNEDIHGSAMLLARTMIHTKNKHITWVSEKGGSAVLTQALRIVSDYKVKLKDHNLFLLDPTTSTNEAIKAAHKAGIEPDRNAIKTGFLNVMGNGDQAFTIINRKRGEMGYTLVVYQQFQCLKQLPALPGLQRQASGL